MTNECGGRLTIEQRGMLVHSLRLVASQLDSDGAEVCEYREQFQRTAREARRLADRLMDAEWVLVGPPREPLAELGGGVR